MESDAYPFTPKTYPIDKGDTIDIGRLLPVRNGQLAAAVDCLDGSRPLCKARRSFPQFGQQFTTGLDRRLSVEGTITRAT
jgi:hypothetical protein